MQKTKEGISLIVLVITILVMIILAAAVIITLNNNGIIDKASDAVDKTNEKQVEELANLAWADAYAENVGKSDEELLQALKESVKKALENNNLGDDYTPYVTTKGVEILKGTGWIQTSDRHVIKGDTVLEIGDNISYDETKGGTVTVDQDVDWQVLGAENGELLILSTDSVYKSEWDTGSYDVGTSSTIEEDEQTYLNYVSNLNEICVPYGKGTYATGARSITTEDVDKVTGYDKTTFGKGTLYEYGNTITYSYNGTNNPAYSGTNGVSGTLGSTHSSGFYWYDEEKGWQSVSASDLTSNTSGIIKSANGVEAKITNTAYFYDAKQYTNIKEESPKAYSMLFDKIPNAEGYWLANMTYYGTNGGNDYERTGRVVYYLNAIEYASYSYSKIIVGPDTTFLSSSGISYNGSSRYVRAVVQLSSECNLTGSSEAGWSLV